MSEGFQWSNSSGNMTTYYKPNHICEARIYISIPSILSLQVISAHNEILAPVLPIAPIQGFTPIIQALDNPEKIKTITIHANVEDWYDAAANNFDTTVVDRD